MKNIIQLFLNILLLLHYSMTTFILMLWYGKLPKVSPYHMWDTKGFKSFTIKDIFNDENVQGKYYYPKEIEKKIFIKKLNELYDKKGVGKYLKQDVPILDDDGEQYGTQTLYSFIGENL